MFNVHKLDVTNKKVNQKMNYQFDLNAMTFFIDVTCEQL